MVKFDLEPEAVDAIVIDELEEIIDSFEGQMKDNEHCPEDEYLGIFSNRKWVDFDRIVHHIEAAKMLIAYTKAESTVF